MDGRWVRSDTGALPWVIFAHLPSDHFRSIAKVIFAHLPAVLYGRTPTLSPAVRLYGTTVRGSMTTKAQQVSVLVEFLNDPANEERTVEDVAEQIVDSFYELLTRDMKAEPPVLKTGVAFRSVLANKVYHVAWNEGDLYWLIGANDRYGYVGPKGPFERFAVESNAKAGAPGTNLDGWKVGDYLSSNQGHYRHTVLAVADRCVLLAGDIDKSGRPYVEPNDHIEKFYVRAAKPNPMFD